MVVCKNKKKSEFTYFLCVKRQNQVTALGVDSSQWGKFSSQFYLCNLIWLRIFLSAPALLLCLCLPLHIFFVCSAQEWEKTFGNKNRNVESSDCAMFCNKWKKKMFFIIKTFSKVLCSLGLLHPHPSLLLCEETTVPS